MIYITMIYITIHLKSSFHSRDIQFFVIISLRFLHLTDSKGQMEVE